MDVMYHKTGGKGFLDTNILKYADNHSDSTNVVLLNAIPGGSGSQQRAGRKVFLNGLMLKLQIIAPAVIGASGDSRNTFRRTLVSIVYDKRPTGSLPAITDIWETADIHSQRNEAGFARFKVLKQFYVSTYGGLYFFLNAPAATSLDGNMVGTGGRPYSFKNKYVKFKTPLVTEYKASGSAATGDIGSFQEGCLYLTMHGEGIDQNDSNDSKLKIHGSTRLKFTDTLN